MRQLLIAALCAGSCPAAFAASVDRIDHGVIVTPDSGPAQRVRILAYGDNQIRVTAIPGTDWRTVTDSLAVVARPAGEPRIETGAGEVKVSLAGLIARVSLADGRVSMSDGSGQPLVAESPRAPFKPVTIEGQPFYTVTQRFNPGTDEGLFGLGQHQNGMMDYNGRDVELAQHNMDIAIPFVLSTRGYGLMWDNNGISRFGNPQPYGLAGLDGLTVRSGGKPGWKADYYLGDRLAISRQESAIAYEFIRDQAKWPAEAKARTQASGESGQNTAGVALDRQRVVWTGDISSPRAGVHRFRLYSSSYAKVFVNGKPVLERWRQNWNPWDHLFEVPLQAGKPVTVRIEWEPNAGYMALRHADPQPDAERHSLTMTSDTAKAIDYYVVGGGTPDKVIANYRALTGKASMLPQWVFGFWQSRQRYETQEQLLQVVREYRKREIPLDNIVLDWRYWVDDQWGSHEFDKSRFPDPKGMVDEVHALGARIMISVWPKFYPNTENGKALAAKGWLYPGNLAMGNRDWVGPGYANTDYDAYAPGARQLYFEQIKTRLVDLGFDAWWLDATEPDIHSNLSIDERIRTMGPTAAGPAAPLFNTYPLVHGGGFADNLRAALPEVRPFILTRSGFAGSQRTSSAVWSGDTAARWDNLREQISAGINTGLSGMPWWTHDIGGFAVEDRYTRQEPAHQAEWRELNLRWFQFGAFTPLFRSHGEFPFREIYEIAKDDAPMYDAMVHYTRLRYRFLPYIYSVAAETALNDSTMMRGLVMDYPDDLRARRSDDAYMFGPALLVAPVSRFKATSREVYLPRGAGWFDLDSGAFHPGGQTISAAAPRERIPVFVRAGSIVPTGPAIQTTRQETDGPLVIHVYAGADARFELYEDDGLSMGYARGEAARIPLSWNEASQTLTIGARQGRFPGMAEKRAMSVRVYRPGQASRLDLGENPARQLVYSGQAVTVSMRQN
ncbi:DUF5110 domain-containing protein [Novosphingobium piscinae]|uniref:DUF5110 domain-containing protein n=1 Tax=Novosphingobium piscinae TaxID=1507448 RepID=A0A7X1FZZ1_9SPHN|nr:DUF5110 domain-containing protein [Novosphingobium piscinae]